MVRTVFQLLRRARLQGAQSGKYRCLLLWYKKTTFLSFVCVAFCIFARSGQVVDPSTRLSNNLCPRLRITQHNNAILLFLTDG